MPIDAPRSVSLALLLALACSGGASRAGELRAAIEPHLGAFAEYDRWARRFALADTAFRSDEAREEAAFAPLRRDRRVAAAWLVREGPGAHALRHPAGAPALPSEGWVKVRTDALGELDVLRTRLDGDAPHLLVRRSAPAPSGATLHVTLAFGE